MINALLAQVESSRNNSGIYLGAAVICGIVGYLIGKGKGRGGLGLLLGALLGVIGLLIIALIGGDGPTTTRVISRRRLGPGLGRPPMRPGMRPRPGRRI